MSAHRSRHGIASGGLRPVSEILAQVAAGSGGTASLQSQRSIFAVAAAAAAGAGTAAAAATGAFPAIQAPTLWGLSDTQSFHRIIEPAAMNTPAPAATPAAVTPAKSVSPADRAALPTSGAGASTRAPRGTVMAEDLHQADASQIASLAHAVSMAKTQTSPTRTSSAAASALDGGSISTAGPAGGLLGTSLTGLALPSSINGVPISGPFGSKIAALALRNAITKKGLPYVWGGAGPTGYDCSGLVMWAYKQLGINLPHSSAQQSRIGTPVSRADLRPGDLVFFYSPVSHVGIYLGDNKIFNAFERGQPLKVSDMSRLPFHNARRIT
jgi:cell wall-associated NlpC family hydrolase